MRVLVIEDREALIEEYLRIFGRVLGDLDIEFIRISSISEAIPPLGEENWEAILVDSDLGPPVTLSPETETEPPSTIRNGYDLIRFRRQAEKGKKAITSSVILGLAPSHVAASLQERAGADIAFLKLHIPQIADFLRKKLHQEKKV